MQAPTGANRTLELALDGATLWDADGHTYTDFLGGYTAGPYGHSHPAVVAAVPRALADGPVLGAARAATGRDAVLVLAGAYHGGVLHFAHGPSPANAAPDDRLATSGPYLVR